VEEDEPVIESTTRRSERLLTAMVIPADACEPIALVALEDSTRAIAAAVGVARVDDDQVATPTGISLGVHVDAAQDAVGSGTPGNTRAAMVLARLGVENRETLAWLRGGVAITGRDPSGADIPVPDEVVTAVGHCGLKTPRPTG
jgi:hypothetical protein